MHLQTGSSVPPWGLQDPRAGVGAAGAQGRQARGSWAGLAASEASEDTSLGRAEQGGKVSKGPMRAAWLSGRT